MNVSTVEEFVKFLPSVTTATIGPGQSNIYMRGLSVGSLGTQGSGTNGPWPNVAVYLDDQSTQVPGRNLDVYAADFERIEVLTGPQGTLFGAGAQAGVLRYITNKPKLNETTANVKAGYANTAHGDDSYNVEGVVNVPLIDDKLALRVVAYQDHRGGYIDNVYSTFTRRGTDQGFARRTGGVVPVDSVVIDNADIAGEDINEVEYSGARASLKWQVNDDWDALLAVAYQKIDGEGVFYQHPLDGFGGPEPQGAGGDRLQHGLHRGRVRQYRADGQRQGRHARPDLRRRLPDARRPDGRGLHELRARRVGLLLPVHRVLGRIGRTSATRRRATGTTSPTAPT